MPLGTKLWFGIEISSSSTSELGIVISEYFGFFCFEGDDGNEERWEGPEMAVSILEVREQLLFRFLVVLPSKRGASRRSVFVDS